MEPGRNANPGTKAQLLKNNFRMDITEVTREGGSDHGPVKGLEYGAMEIPDFSKDQGWNEVIFYASSKILYAL